MPRFAPYGFSRSLFNFRIPFTGFLSVAAQATLLASLAPGFRFAIEKVALVPVVAAAGAGASRVVNVRKGGAAGTVVATVTATLANGALGQNTAGVVTTADKANEFGDTDNLTIELPAGGTVFTAGEYELSIQLRALAQREA